MPRTIRWNIILTTICLMALFWVLDAFLDGVIYADRGFVPQLIDFEKQELVDRLQTFLVVCLLAGYAWRQSDIQEQLMISLEVEMAAHKAERTRAEAILAAMGDAVSVQNPELQIIYQNRAHKELMGDHKGEYCYTAYHQRDVVCPECDLVKTLATGLNHSTEISFETDSGISYREIRTSPLRIDNGEIVAGIECVRETTERKLTELQLRRQLAAIEASLDGIAILSSKEEYLYLNDAHASVYGYGSPNELIGKNWRILYDEQERQRLEPLIFEGFKASGGWRGEATGLKKDGSRFSQEISLSLLEDGGLICVVRDISERKRSEDAIRLLNDNLQKQALDLQATNRDLEAFGYSLSHDLRSPLNRVYMAVQALEMEEKICDETGRTLLSSIRSGCESMDELITAMIILFKVTQGEICRKDVNLSALAAETMAGLYLLNADRKVEIVIEPDLVASCDEQLTRVLLENLIGNAWKYSTGVDNARIEFGRSEVNGKPVYFVHDNGAGFDMAEAGRLFVPFQRLHNSRRFPGTGVGLATVLRIVERHGGTVRGEGVVDGGATFYFTLS